MLVLVRDVVINNSIHGKMFLNGHFVCNTLENKSKAIPCGRYAVANSKSPKFGRELPLVYNGLVQASRGIRIHCGNCDSDSSGCILVGMGRNLTNNVITESKVAEAMVVALCRNCSSIVITEE